MVVIILVVLLFTAPFSQILAMGVIRAQLAVVRLDQVQSVWRAKCELVLIIGVLNRRGADTSR